MDGSIAMPSMGGGLGDDGRGSESGQSANSQLLRLVARANANVAELMRLSDYVPKIFYLEGEDARLYGPILQDYAYFQKADLIEEKMSVDPVSASAAASASASASWSPSASGCGEPPARADRARWSHTGTIRPARAGSGGPRRGDEGAVRRHSPALLQPLRLHLPLRAGLQAGPFLPSEGAASRGRRARSAVVG